ncbi:putative polysaccharide biosynthesis protein, partial [Gorillibacterium massiliense]|uniref:putative polysaccharide biosynthesis protein n=1 Tax=Gorillibacterium massiliense TaxID=1280390 RepID=UPI0006938557
MKGILGDARFGVENKENRKGSALLKGAAALGIAAVLSKLLGTMQKIPLQNLAGDEAFGIYSIVYPLYTLILTLATAGFPLTVSRFVSEELAWGREKEARRVLGMATAVLTVTGLLFFAVLYLGADPLAKWLGARLAAPAIRSVSFALLIVPVMAALRGYFQGRQDMVPTAVSQVVEQLIRVATMLGLLLYFLDIGASNSRIAAGATFGSVTGAVGGLAVMLIFWQRSPRSKNAKGSAAADGEAQTAMGGGLRPEAVGLARFVRTALAVCLGSIALPLLTLMDSVSLPSLLAKEGMGESARLAEVGLYNHAQPLVQLIGLIATSMSAALVPAIAEAKAQGQMRTLKERTEFSVRFAWFIGFAASFGLMAAAEPLNVMFFTSAEGSATMGILAFTAMFSVLNIVTGSILIGFGATTAPAVSLFAAAALKLLLNALLVPAYGIRGAAVAAVAAYALAGLANLAVLARRSGVRFGAGALLWRPLAAAAAMCAAVAAVRF